MNTEATKDPGSALLEGERLVARVWRLLALRGVPGAATQHRVWLALHALVGLVVGTAVLRARGLRIPPG